MKILVPATSANLGPGFDSCGIALNRYLTVEIGEASANWKVHHEFDKEVPSDLSNLLIQTTLKLAPNLKPHMIYMKSSIPLARGLGSSSSVVVAGIELANQLGNLGLLSEEKIKIATEIEGHPDNVAPAVLGDFVVASFVKGKVASFRCPFPKVGIVGFIPDRQLLTSASREVLPSKLSFKEAVIASSIANVMIGAILSNDLKFAGQMMEQDLFHEKYRSSLVPQMGMIRELSRKFAAYATYLSGAGPTIITFLPPEKVDAFAKALAKIEYKGTIEVFEIDHLG
ncbi:MAG: homoserine kinase, partial [Streptococcaceae bacterium]|nr:homoserine kinase [Streptococcaceae bacterium]